MEKQGLVLRRAEWRDLDSILKLFTFLHDEVPPLPEKAAGVWRQMMDDPKIHVLLALVGESLAASCALVVVPNLTRRARSFAVVENVVCHPQYRRRGYALATLRFAEEIARMEDCYKLMLMSGQKHAGAQHLYQKAGYNQTDKTAFVRWL